MDITASPYLVPFDDSFRLASARTAPPDDAPGRKELRKDLPDVVDEIAQLQRRLYADDRHALLLVFQAMDAAGKDSTIRKVFSGVNPAGFQVHAFNKPSREELDHDFLWRTTVRLPERGRIGIFNRSHYEEVLVVRVHPELLDFQRLPRRPDDLWDERLQSIREHERHLARNGTTILKFFLHVSPDEQARRFLERIENPKKNWKFRQGDMDERKLFPAYMDAYEQALRATSRPWAPWYAIPADSKDYMRLTVARLVRDTLERMDPRYPEIPDEDRAVLDGSRKQLERELGG